MPRAEVLRRYCHCGVCRSGENRGTGVWWKTSLDGSNRTKCSRIYIQDHQARIWASPATSLHWGDWCGSEQVQKYVELQLDDKLDRPDDRDTLYRKRQSWHYFLKRLRSCTLSLYSPSLHKHFAIVNYFSTAWAIAICRGEFSSKSLVYFYIYMAVKVQYCFLTAGGNRASPRLCAVRVCVSGSVAFFSQSGQWINIKFTLMCLWCSENAAF